MRHQGGTSSAGRRRSYSLRERLDLIVGALLLCMTLAGSFALSLARRQLSDTRWLQVLDDQEWLINDFGRTWETVTARHAQGGTLERGQIEALRTGLAQLTRNLRALRDGGELSLRHDGRFHVQPLGDPTLLGYVDAALAVLERCAVELTTASLEDSVSLSRSQRELQALMQGLSAAAVSRSSAAVLQISTVQLALMCGGILWFLFGVLLLRRLVTTPLHRMADQIEVMQTTGRLIKLPVIDRNELGVVADGFNRLAEQVEEQKRRLRAHVVELQRMNAEFDQLANLKDDFLATISHQLRTPLVAITEGLGLMREGAVGSLNAEQASFLEMLSRNVAQLKHLIDQTLDLSLLKSNRRLVDPKPGDLGEVLQQSTQVWQETAASTQSIQLTCGSLQPVYMDAHAIREVMDHLLRNALRHSPERGEVRINAKLHDGVVEVVVSNQGSGMSPEQLARLFEPFTHVQTPDAPGSQGSGLGLSYCRQIIERHRGSIRAESPQGQGMAVTFSLPVASPTFLFEEACRCSDEEAHREGGQFGLLLATPAATGVSGAVDQELLGRAETVLRRNTHRGDRFVRLDQETLAILAVTDAPGMEAMAARLSRVLRDAQLAICLATAVCPGDGDTPQRLLATARGSMGRMVLETTR